MSERGFTLLELLVACLLVVAVTAAVAAIATPMREVFERSLASADLEGGRRAGLELLAHDLRQAGGGAAVAASSVTLAALMPPVVPLQGLGSTTVASPGHAVRVSQTPLWGAQATLVPAVSNGVTTLPLDTTARCSGGAPTCGFIAGMTATLYSAVAAETVRVSALGGGVVFLQAPLVNAYPVGAALAELSVHTYGLRAAGSGSNRLVRVTAAGAEQPLLENVVAFEVTPDTTDLMRVREVAIRLRLEAASAAQRGPAGSFFTRSGTALGVRSWVPDLEMRFVVSLRNGSRS